MKEKTMRDGKLMLCEELEKIVEKGKLSMGDLEILHKLTDTLKNMLKIEMLEGEDEGYSERRDSMGRYAREDGMQGREMYDERGGSYRSRRGTHYVRGHYSREDGMGGGMRETRGRYSREDGKDRVMHELGEMMEDADEETRRTLERAMMEIRKA